MIPTPSLICLSDSPRFEINFLCDQDDRIAFHFNPRFTESDIVCNSFLANQWGQEERCTNFPFGTDEHFQVKENVTITIYHVLYIHTYKVLIETEWHFFLSLCFPPIRSKLTQTMTTSMFTSMTQRSCSISIASRTWRPSLKSRWWMTSTSPLWRSPGNIFAKMVEEWRLTSSLWDAKLKWAFACFQWIIVCLVFGVANFRN